jgi:hypothetical protein
VTTWDAAAVAVDYRLRIEAARARLTQALIVLDATDPGLPPPDVLIRDALDALDAPARPERRRRAASTAARTAPDAPTDTPCGCSGKAPRSRPAARKNGMPVGMFEALRKGRIAAA